MPVLRTALDLSWLAWHSVATLSYLIEREKDAATARAVVTDLLDWVQPFRGYIRTFIQTNA